MIEAQKKRKENITEYLLYMWQIEDLIRAYNFDINKLDDHFVAQYKVPEEQKQEIRAWYERLIQMMQEEGVKEKGHIHIIRHVMDELQELHLKLLNNNDKEYLQAYQKNTGNIQTLKTKMNNKDAGAIEAILTGLYGVVMLRLKNKELTGETAAAVKSLTQMMNVLAEKFKAYESGKLELK